MRVSIQLQSSFLRSADYDPETETLDIQFANGQTYTYENVPQKTFEDLRDAPSPGSFYHSSIKDAF